MVFIRVVETKTYREHFELSLDISLDLGKHHNIATAIFTEGHNGPESN